MASELVEAAQATITTMRGLADCTLSTSAARQLNAEADRMEAAITQVEHDAGMEKMGFTRDVEPKAPPPVNVDDEVEHLRVACENLLSYAKSWHRHLVAKTIRGFRQEDVANPADVSFGIDDAIKAIVRTSVRRPTVNAELLEAAQDFISQKNDPMTHYPADGRSHDPRCGCGKCGVRTYERLQAAIANAKQAAKSGDTCRILTDPKCDCIVCRAFAEGLRVAHADAEEIIGHTISWAECRRQETL